ncbi:MAG: hypothetical protein JWP63_4152 [Candidatus Solibacter sp.]|nr:hypothetical protein [Candidatus Solibacter sp.]
MRFALAFLAACAAVSAQTPFQIVTDSLPLATVGVPYLQQLVTTAGACQGTGTATNTIEGGALPAGIYITSPSGQKQWTVAGVPTISGTFTFTVHIFFSLDRRTPFVQPCNEDAVKTLTLVIGNGQPTSTLIVDRAQITSIYRLGQLRQPVETVSLTSTGGVATQFTAKAATTSGGNWLSVSPAGGVTPSQLTLSLSPSALAAGVYTGTVTVTPATGNPLTIAVTLSVILDTSIVLSVTPASFSFSSIAGAAAPAAQTLKVTVSGDNVVFQADVNAPPSGKWLVVTPSASATPTLLSSSVDPKTLTPGTYNGAITLRVAGVPNQVVPVTYTVQPAPSVPAISANGVVNAANTGAAATAPGTWISIFGANLSATTRSWATADFVGGKLPTSLDGAGVTINGKSAAVAFVSSTQINVLAPDDTATGLVAVQVKSPAGTSDNAFVLQQTAAPAFFQFRGGAKAYVAGTHADNSYLAGTTLIQQGILGTPAKPGETVVLYGTGFGATQPAISSSALVTTPAPLANLNDLRIRIAGVDCAIVFAGLISPGLYQFNVVVPPQVPDGDQAVVAELRGLLTRADLLVPIQH